jgi:hypothetical protein
VTRAQIRAPLTAKRSLWSQGNPTPLTMWKPRLAMSRPRFKTRKTEDPGQDPHWQDATIPTSWQHLWPVPHKGDSPSTSLRLARQVSASHGLPSTLTSVWAMTRGASLRREHLRYDAWENDSPRHAYAPAGGHASSWPRQEP